MNRIYVRGLGAVSPAGWGVAALCQAVEAGIPLPTTSVARPGWEGPLRIREVPPPSPRPAFLAHARLRRASAITQYAAGAVFEALGIEVGGALPGSRRLGLVMCALTGCGQYSQRFFDETLRDPATASPLIFPETVFNAPASHIAVLLGTAPLSYTLIGDAGTFLQGVALGADWLLEDRVDGCLVVGAEETNWLLGDVLWHFDHHATLGGGAGALYLTRGPAASPGVALECVTDAFLYSARQSRRQAAEAMRQALAGSGSDELLCDGLQGRPQVDAAEAGAWRDWKGARLSPKRVLGEGLMAAGAWQCVAACQAVAQQTFRTATVSIVGTNQQAVGARFVRTGG